MNKLRQGLRFFAYIFCVFGLLALMGCTILQNRVVATEVVEEQPTPIALPTQLNHLVEVASQTCLVAEIPVIQTDKAQGALIAWAPRSDLLTFVQPVNQISGWYIGDLKVYDPVKQEITLSSRDQAVFGDLTWSPDGESLAYIILDQDNGYYTIKTVNLADGVETDVFSEEGSARTNDFASLKGIRQWSSASSLEVTSSCGTDCVRVYIYNPVSQSLTQQEEIRQNENTSLAIENEYASPDTEWLVTVDDEDNVWLTDTTINRISLLLAASTTQEIKWSQSSKYLAVRIVDRIYLYETGCSE